MPSTNGLRLLLALLLAVPLFGAGEGCDCHPKRPDQDDTATGEDSTITATAGSGDASGASVTTDAATTGGQGDAAWALDTFHVVQEIHGVEPQYRIDKLTLREDRTTEQRAIRCGSPDAVWAGTWESASDGSVSVLPPAGAGRLTFAGSDYSRLVVQQTADCDEVSVEGFSPAGALQGSTILVRGDRCLNCGNVAEDQITWCAGRPPAPCGPQ